GHRASGRATALPPELVGGARHLSGVAAVDTYRGSPIVYAGTLATVVGIEFGVQRDYGHLQFKDTQNGRAVLDRALATGGVVVTESFGPHHRVRTGDWIVLPAPAGPVRLRVEGVFYDYSTDAGAVVMDHALYTRLWGDERTESLAIYLRPGVHG